MNYNYLLILLAILFNLYIIQYYDFKRPQINYTSDYDFSLKNFSMTHITDQEMLLQLQAHTGIATNSLFELNGTRLVKKSATDSNALTYIQADNMYWSAADRSALLQDGVMYRTTDILIQSDKLSYEHHPPLIKGYNFNGNIDGNTLQGSYFEYDIEQEIFSAHTIKLLIDDKYLPKP